MDEALWPRYFVELSYDGAHFHGWQRQPNALSVQEVLESAFCKVMRQEKVITTGCGRTDTGVHATEFYAHFNAMTPIADTAQLVFRVNQVLPKSIAVHRIFSVADKAHARFDATERGYHYYLHFKKDPFLHQRSMYYPYELDMEKMNAAAHYLIRKGDFSSFCKSGGGQKTNICDVRKAAWSVNENGQWVFHIVADRFLRNMVRAVVGTLIEVGRGKLDVKAMQDIIDMQQRGAAGDSVYACGLYLTQVSYPYLKMEKHVE
ncbi:MAG: tRNA pseudouridine(38-40) synthase TruA [Bacteroidota bacterium]|jgi:tRNA pseudouridine38-40 synthase